jgi:hypothetical protein
VVLTPNAFWSIHPCSSFNIDESGGPYVIQ